MPGGMPNRAVTFGFKVSPATLFLVKWYVKCDDPYLNAHGYTLRRSTAVRHINTWMEWAQEVAREQDDDTEGPQ